MTPRRILFVELLGGIGDLIFALPAIDALKRSHRLAAIDVLTFAPGGELLVGDPRVRQVFFARRVKGEGSEKAVRDDLRAILDTCPYDLVISDARHSGIPDVIDASRAERKVSQLWSGAGRDEPIAGLFLRRLREEELIDAASLDSRARVFISDDERRAAAATWASLGLVVERTVILNPHSGVAVKRWPAESFVALGQALAADGWGIAVLGGDDPALAWKISQLIPDARFLPRMPLRLTAACLERTCLVVSADTGIAHLASAVGSPVLAIFGPTWSGRYGVAPPSINLQTPFDCPERNPMNFTTQRCWYSGECIFPGKANCCEDVSPATAVEAAHRLLRRDLQSHSAGDRTLSREPLPFDPGGSSDASTSRLSSLIGGDEGGEVSA